MVAKRHTCFGLEKALVVLKGVTPCEMNSSYCISAGSCEEGMLGKKIRWKYKRAQSIFV